ncbi:hypothetical protein ANN_05586 [Periplaneta americana]|uniref:Uncharacterized protein n=1 Tax=Periplaneta americana TaxID=6978 RepID=A0ABQ8TCY8_PERAM|nr:hypothetical protein ANN_05586 [Periplaneta americana]
MASLYEGGNKPPGSLKASRRGPITKHRALKKQPISETILSLDLRTELNGHDSEVLKCRLLPDMMRRFVRTPELNFQLVPNTAGDYDQRTDGRINRTKEEKNKQEDESKKE